MVDTSHVDLLALISEDTPLKLDIKAGRGVYTGPCPFCGTGDDRFHVWPHKEKPNFWCRRCEAKGDAIDYLMQRDGISFKEACERLGTKPDMRRAIATDKALPKPNSKYARAHWEATENPEWQRRANAFLDYAFDMLHFTGKSVPGRDYLRKRGLSESVTAAHRLGYTPDVYRGKWGTVEVYIPARSIVLPWEESIEQWDGQAWVPARILKVKYRCIDKRQFGQATGGAEGLYGWPYYRPGKPVVLVEGEICALSIWQAAPGLVVPLATGSADGARLYHCATRLALARQLILAFDADDAGDEAAHWWQKSLPHAIRLRPTQHDVNDMLTAGDDIAAWFKAALPSLRDAV